MAKKVREPDEIERRVAQRMADTCKRMIVHCEEKPSLYDHVNEMELAYWQQQREKYLARAGM